MPDAICARCGYSEAHHLALNYADGPHVSGSVLVCPTATFLLAKPQTPKGRRYPCYVCGKSVTSELPDDSVFRVVLICPECLAKGVVIQEDADEAPKAR